MSSTISSRVRVRRSTPVQSQTRVRTRTHTQRRTVVRREQFRIGFGPTRRYESHRSHIHLTPPRISGPRIVQRRDTGWRRHRRYPYRTFSPGMRNLSEITGGRRFHNIRSIEIVARTNHDAPYGEELVFDTRGRTRRYHVDSFPRRYRIDLPWGYDSRDIDVALGQQRGLFVEEIIIHHEW